MIPNASTILEIARVAKALGDTTRLKLIEMMRGGEKMVKELQELVGKDQPIISQQLKELSVAGLVKYSRQGARKYYRVASPEVFNLLLTSQVYLGSATRVPVLFKALSDVTRVIMTFHVQDRRECTPLELRDAVDRHPSTVSQHLKRLRRAGVLAVRREGTQRFFRLADPTVEEILDQLLAMVAPSSAEQKVVLMGLDGSGKTSIALSMRGARNLLDFFNLPATRGVSRETFVKNATKYHLWDCGGQQPLVQRYLNNFAPMAKGTSQFIFVIDVQDQERYPLALEYLKGIVERILTLGERPKFSVYIHKFDPGLEGDPRFSHKRLEQLLYRGVRSCFPPDFSFEIFRTTIFTVFRRQRQGEW
ncbi:MAG: hypothetical protein Kow0069_04280 [Promethearchaeota archaeon]